MHKRPISITIIGWIFIAVGIVGLIYHSTHPKEGHILWILFLRFLALSCGVCLLLRQNWARWLAAVWLAYHVYVGYLHALSEMIIHTLLFAIITFFLFRRSATAYFRGKDSPPTAASP